MDDEFGDFGSSDPLERYNAHQRAKGRATLGDPSMAVKASRENPPGVDEIRCVYGRHFDAVYLNDTLLDPAPSLAVFNHSPDGFSWGYGGSGPAQLALAILLAVTGNERVSVRLHQDFKQEFLESLPQGSCVLHVNVMKWVREHAGMPSR